MSESVELDFSASRGPLSGVYRGREGAREFWASFSGGRVLTVSPVRAAEVKLFQTKAEALAD